MKAAGMATVSFFLNGVSAQHITEPLTFELDTVPRAGEAIVISLRKTTRVSGVVHSVQYSLDEEPEILANVWNCFFDGDETHLFEPYKPSPLMFSVDGVKFADALRDLRRSIRPRVEWETDQLAMASEVIAKMKADVERCLDMLVRSYSREIDLDELLKRATEPK